MNRVRTLLFLVAAGIATSALGQLSLRLESDVRSKLPGLPVSVRLVAVNNGTTEIALPLSIFFHASREGAESFLGGDNSPWVKEPPGDSLEYPDWDYRLRLAPGATLVTEQPISGNCEGPGFLLRPFLFKPGTYSIRVLAAPNRTALADAVRNATLSEVLTSVPDVTVSAPMLMEVRQPEGVDAEAWSYVLEQSNGEGWHWVRNAHGYEVQHLAARELRQRFLTSRYTQCFGATHLREESLASLESFAATLRAVTPRPPMLDWVELTIAGRHSNACSRHMAPPRNVAAAVEECEMARTLYSRALTTVTLPQAREAAQRELDATMTGAAVRNHVLHREAVAAGIYQKVRPFVQCLKETGKKLEVRFGYDNPNAFYVPNPGNSNFFEPGPADRGQPKKYLPGRHEDVVTVEIEGKKNDPQRTITWTLDGLTATAPSDSIPRCKGK